MVDKSEKFSWFVRLGYAARGLLYIIIGYLALSSSGHDKSQRGAMAYVHDSMPGGAILLYLTAAGLLAYAAFKLCSCAFDVEHHGGDAKGLAVRAAKGATGLIYAALAWSAFQFANGHSHSAGNGATVQHAEATLLTFSVGALVLGAIGLGFFGGASAQAILAATARFMRRMSSATPKAIEYAGRAGHAARAAVFAVIGWSLVYSAWWHHTDRMHSIGDAIDALAGRGVLYTIVAAGLLLFGVFSMLAAYYRIIPDIDSGDLKARLH